MMERGTPFPKGLTNEENEILIGRKLEHIPSRIPEENKAKLLEGNLRLVSHVINRLNLYNLDKDDLINVGTLGLVKALNSFNPSLNTKLSTYCATCITNEIFMFIRRSTEKATILSLERPISTDREGNEITLMDILSDDTDVLDNLLQKNEIIILNALLNKLSADEKFIIYCRYFKRLKFRQIADTLGISRSYVSRKHGRILQKLRESFKTLDI